MYICNMYVKKKEINKQTKPILLELRFTNKNLTIEPSRSKIILLKYKIKLKENKNNN